MAPVRQRPEDRHMDCNDGRFDEEASDSESDHADDVFSPASSSNSGRPEHAEGRAVERGRPPSPTLTLGQPLQPLQPLSSSPSCTHRHEDVFRPVAGNPQAGNLGGFGASQGTQQIQVLELDTTASESESESESAVSGQTLWIRTGCLPFAFCQYTKDEDAVRAMEDGKGTMILGLPCRTEMVKANRSFIIYKRNRMIITVDEARGVMEKRTTALAGNHPSARLTW
ncbi:hypothetical protein V8F33_003800 [Rhypophila sp. PSN 637]